jgi:citrate lyase subunit beta/citryl-CoA lyase
VERAGRILAALDEAAREGRGAAQLDGKMIDAASARMAENVVRMQEAVAGRGSRVANGELPPRGPRPGTRD